MGILYSPADNKITVTGYSALTPCNFTNLWTEDKAGTLELMPATLPALNMVLTTQIKPSDEVALKIDFILASSGAGAGDTVDITGTDKDGNAQSETLTTTADGTFTTTKWFKTITDIDCNGFNSGTLTVIQNQWGVVWKTGDNQFLFDAAIYINFNSYFADTKKQIEFGSNAISIGYRWYFYANTGSVVTFGTSVDDTKKVVRDGCHFVFNGATYGRFEARIGVAATMKLYACTFTKTSQDIYIRLNDDSLAWWCIYDKVILENYGSQYGCIFLGQYFRQYGGTIQKCQTLGGKWAVQWLGTAIDLSDLFTRGQTTAGFVLSGTSGNIHIIDADIELWTFTRQSGATAAIYRQYTFNLKVIDKDGNGIGNATVILKDKDGNTADQKGFSTTTSDADATRGEITEQTVSYGYYNQANGNTLQSYSPHTLTISKTGFQTHTQILTLDEKIDWRQKLNRIGHPPAAWEHNV